MLGDPANRNRFGRGRGQPPRGKLFEIAQLLEARARRVLSFAVADGVEAEVSDDLHHPWLERATELTEVVAMSPDASERLVDDLISEVVVGDQLSSKSFRLLLVPLHQHAESLIGVGRDEGHQLIVRQVLQFRFLDGH